MNPIQSFIGGIQQRFSQQLTQGKQQAQQYAQNLMSNLGNIYNRVSNTITNQPLIQSPFGVKVPSPTVGQAADFVADIPRSIARIGWEGAQTLTGDKNTYQFKTGPMRQILDDRPLMSWNNPNRPAAQFSKSIGHPELAAPLISLGIGLDLMPWTSGKGQVAKQGIDDLGKVAAKAKLKGLLTYQDQLVKTGQFTAQQAEKIGYQKAQQYLAQTGRDVLKNMRSIAPERQQAFNQLFARFIGQKEIARTVGTERGSKFVGIPDNIGWQVIRAIEEPHFKASPEVYTIANRIKGEFDQLYKEANAAGMNVGYLRNYITHIWKESPEEVQAAFQAANQKFKFANKRQFMTYQDGIAAGLRPKFSHPAELISHYTRKLEETKAGIALFKDLKKQGFIVDAATGAKMPGYEKIIAKGFPESISKSITGETVVSQWYAPADVAQLMNKVFNPEVPMNRLEKTLDITGKISSKMQDIALSGGLPRTPMNAFSVMAGLQRELLAGRVVSPLTDFVRAFSKSKTDSFFFKNVDQVKKMQSRNIPVQMSTDVSGLIDKGFIRNTFGDDVGQAWNATFADPTFKRFFPALQINLFNSIESKMLAAGKTPDEAIDIAAKAVKNFYGLTSTDDLARRSKIGQDFAKTVFFAPKFRESMLWFWKNNVKALANPLAPENQMNVRFMIGALAAYIAMDYVNYQLNGKHMAENPEGKRATLLIPAGDTTIGIPYLSSIATLPRAAYEAGRSAIEGSPEGVAKQAGTFLSIPVKPSLEVLSNENYFGSKIYSEEDSQEERTKKVITYLATAWSHPYFKHLVLNQEKPLSQRLSMAAELPFRYYETEDIDKSYFFTNEKEVLKGLSEDERRIYDQLHKAKAVDEDGLPVASKRMEMANALMRLSNTNVLKAEAEIARRTAEETNQPLNPFYNLSPEQQTTVLVLKTMYPGSQEKKDLQSQNLAWLKPYWNERDQWVSYMQQAGIFKESIDDGRPKASPQLQQQLDYYSTLPKGTGARSAYIAQNPQIAQFFDQSAAFTNKQREELGLAPLPTYASSAGGYSRKGRSRRVSLKLRKPKKIKLISSKVKAPKIKEPKLTLKPAKRIAYKPTLVKQPKLERITA